MNTAYGSVLDSYSYIKISEKFMECFCFERLLKSTQKYLASRRIPQFLQVATSDFEKINKRALKAIVADLCLAAVEKGSKTARKASIIETKRGGNASQS